MKIIIFISALLCGLTNRETEFHWIEKVPSTMDSLFWHYRDETGLPYSALIAENWLTYNPLLKYNLHAGGRRGWTYIRGLDGRPTKVHPLEIGNLNGDDVIDLHDFAIYAGRYGNGHTQIDPAHTKETSGPSDLTAESRVSQRAHTGAG